MKYWLLAQYLGSSYVLSEVTVYAFQMILHQNLFNIFSDSVDELLSMFGTGMSIHVYYQIRVRTETGVPFFKLTKF